MTLRPEANRRGCAVPKQRGDKEWERYSRAFPFDASERRESATALSDPARQIIDPEARYISPVRSVGRTENLRAGRGRVRADPIPEFPSTRRRKRARAFARSLARVYAKRKGEERGGGRGDGEPRNERRKRREGG